jgi:hypothetical protein
MSINLSAVAVTEFDSMVKHAYANAGLLKNARRLARLMLIQWT